MGLLPSTFATVGGRLAEAGRGRWKVLFIAIILYAAAIVAVAHALARE